MPQGANGHVGIAKEVTWGTAVAATDYIPLISESLTESIEQIADESIKASRFENKSIPGQIEVKGDIVAEVRPTSIGYLLRSALGAVTVTGTGTYTHTFTPASTAFDPDCFLPPYTLEVNRDHPQAWQYAGAVVNSLQFAFGAKQKLLRATAGIIAKNATLITKTTPNFEAAAPFTWDQAAVQLGGTAFARLEDFGLKLDNKMAGIFLLSGDRNIDKLYPDGRSTADADLTMDIIDMAQYNAFKASTDQTLTVTFTAGTNVLKFTLPNLRYIDYPVNIGGPGRIAVKVKGKVFVDNTFKIELTNSKTSYLT